MTVTFDVNQVAQKSLGNDLLRSADYLIAINNRIGNVEAAKTCYPTFSYESYNDLARLGMRDEFVEKHKKSFIEKENKGFSHPLIEAASAAYNKHYPLTISPDCIWICIIQALSHHINLNSDSLKKKFLSQDEEMSIIIDRPDFKKGDPNNNWEECMNEFSNEIGKFIGDKKDLIVSNFSTTSHIEKCVSEIILMDCVKSYFKFSMMTMCGIPKITLSGTTADWEDIFLRVIQLSEYDLEWWIKSLLPIITELIKTSEGNPNIKFWDNFFKITNESGGPYISGWINVLFPYIQNERVIIRNEYSEIKNLDKITKYGPETNNFPNGFSKVPFKWNYYGTIYDMELLGGMFGFYQDKETFIIAPNIGWAIKEINKNNV